MGRYLFGGWGNKDAGVFGPVGGELSEGGGAEDEGGRGEAGEVAVEGGNRLDGRQSCVPMI